MQWQQVEVGYTLRGSNYQVLLILDEVPHLHFSFDGRDIMTLPVIGTVSHVETKEILSDISLEEISSGKEAGLTFSAQSNLWNKHTFSWRFDKQRGSFSQSIVGEGNLGRCFFASTGESKEYANGDSQGYLWNSQILVPHYYTAAVNLGNTLTFDIGMPNNVGFDNAALKADYFSPERYNNLFAPPPLFYDFYTGHAHMGLGIGTHPGQYRFNSFEYSGSQFAGASFSINYLGYTMVKGNYTLPEVSITFGYSSYEALEKHINWLDDNHFSTQFRYSTSPWHRAPVLCGWAEQTTIANQNSSHMQAHALATQENYENWITQAEERAIPFSTIVIDDKWQKEYGTFTIDEKKWPDLKGFIDKQHSKGRHVLLWVPGYHIEGLPDEWCVTDKKGNKLFADVSNPAYEAFLREKIRTLIANIGADGFKEDWIARTAKEAGLPGYGSLHGLEWLRKFQFILHDESHKAKPDALIQTQTPHPLFRESSDVLRLNDIAYATRNVSHYMRDRARIARICGWGVIDCDNASSTTAEEWFLYARQQPKLGVPSLYFLSKTEVTHQSPSSGQWHHISELWQDYIQKNF